MDNCPVAWMSPATSKSWFFLSSFELSSYLYLMLAKISWRWWSYMWPTEDGMVNVLKLFWISTFMGDCKGCWGSSSNCRASVKFHAEYDIRCCSFARITAGGLSDGATVDRTIFDESIRSLPFFPYSFPFSPIHSSIVRMDFTSKWFLAWWAGESIDNIDVNEENKKKAKAYWFYFQRLGPQVLTENAALEQD